MMASSFSVVWSAIPGDEHRHVSGRQRRLRANDVGGFLADHDGRRIEVAAHHRRHDRRIDDAQTLGAAHAQAGVDHGHGIVGSAHLAGGRRVEGALGLAPDVGVDVGVGGDRRPGRELRAAIGIERFLREDLAREADRVAEFLTIAFGREIVEKDPRRLPGIRRR
jgi:hypothetical protein